MSSIKYDLYSPKEWEKAYASESLHDEIQIYKFPKGVKVEIYYGIPSYKYGREFWYQLVNNEYYLHRMNAPAIYQPRNNYCEWWYRGVKLKKEEYNSLMLSLQN